MVNTNIVGDESEKFATFTYGYPMTDTKQVQLDFKKCWAKLKYRYPNLGYIAVIEPQENGNWHLHVFLKNMNNEKLYIPKEVLDKVWDKGFYHIESIEPNCSDNMRCILYS